MNEIFFPCMIQYKLSIILLIFITACGQEERGNNKSSYSSSFEKLDSVKVPFRGKFTVHDLDPHSKTVLFESNEQQPEIILADFSGKIRTSFLSTEFYPDDFGRLLAPLKIDGEDSIIAYGSNGFLNYDFSGKLQSKVVQPKRSLPERGKLEMGEGIEKDGNRYLFISEEFRKTDQMGFNLHEEFRLLVWLHPKTGKSESFVEFPESSIFRQGRFFFKDAWKPVFTLVDDLIYVVFGIEPVIYVFEKSPPYALVSSISIDLPEYRYSQGSDSFSSHLNHFELPFYSGKILNIKWVDGHFVIAYFTGLNSLDSKEFFEGKSTQELISTSRKIRKKYPTRIAIIDSLGNLIKDFVPEGLVPKSMLVRNGELWMLEMPDEELGQDYFRLFRVGLKLED